MSLLRLNLEVKILATTELTERKLVILVSAESENDELFHRESYRLDCERYLKFGTGAVPQTEFDAANKEELSSAMKLYLTWLMVERALKFVHLKDFEVVKPHGGWCLLTLAASRLLHCRRAASVVVSTMAVTS